MDNYGGTWAIVLAGGDGLRLSALTTSLSGVAIPKQYCSVWGGSSLLEDALVRAAAIAPLRRICTVVAASHRQWWSTTLARQAGDNIIVQPQNRGTGIGILLALLRVLERDPYANVLLMPADHYLKDEVTMAASLQRMTDLAAANTDSVYLLGAEPSGPDPALGYIVPAEQDRDRPSGVRSFVEKPTPSEAEALLARGALVNVSIVAGSVGTLLSLYERAHAREVMALSAALLSRVGDFAPLAAAYDKLPSIDFSQNILAHQTSTLNVLRFPQCGWTDLGTPERVAEILKTPPRQASMSGSRSTALAYLSLAARWVVPE